MKTRAELEQENARIRAMLARKISIIDSKDAFIDQLKKDEISNAGSSKVAKTDSRVSR